MHPIRVGFSRWVLRPTDANPIANRVRYCPLVAALRLATEDASFLGDSRLRYFQSYRFAAGKTYTTPPCSGARRRFPSQPPRLAH